MRLHGQYNPNGHREQDELQIHERSQIDNHPAEPDEVA